MGAMALASHQPLVYVEIKPGADPVKVHQYPVPLKARRGIITSHVRRLLELGAIQWTWNTSMLLVKKSHSNDYWIGQSLREVNKREADIHPTVPNPDIP